MGSSGKRPKTPVRTILVASGAALAVLTAAAGALAAVTNGGSTSTGSATAARIAPQATKAQAPQVGTATATPSRSTTPKPKPTRTTAKPKPKPKPTKTSTNRVVSSGSCEASYYSEGQMTASGEAFNPGELTAAHKTLPFGSKVRVTNKNNGRAVVVRINDRGPFVSGRCLDLSRAAMAEVGGTGSGVIPVRYQVLKRT